MFKPFENETASSAIYDLNLENGLDRINMYGNLQITKDQAGLKTAKALRNSGERQREIIRVGGREEQKGQGR